MDYIIVKQELIEIICCKSFQYSDKPVFKLASGKMSQFYINCKPTTLSARGIFLIGQLVYDMIKKDKISGIGGLSFGADPIAIATSFTSEINKNPISAFSIRKKQKDHGIIKWLEGDVKKGDNVVIIEDVVTTGGSTIKAIQRAQSEGLNVIKVIVLIDRQEGGIDNIKQHIKNVDIIISKKDLLAHLNK